MLSDHAFSLFGWSFTISSQAQLIAVIAAAVLATAWIVNFFRRRRSVVLHRSAVSDQLLYELSRIADSLDRIASRPVEDVFSSGRSRIHEPMPDSRDSREIPYSMFGRER